MTTENSMNSAAAATISEKELWAAFLPLTITKSVTFSPFNDCATEKFVPAVYVSHSAYYCNIEAIGGIIADDLKGSEKPSETLIDWINDLEAYLACLKVVAECFCRISDRSLVRLPEREPELRQNDPDAYKAWEAAANEAERNPRYRPPVGTSEQGEAA